MVTLPLLWVFLGALSVVSPFTCRFCDRTDCGAPLKCKGSIGYDACGCCPQCAQLEGQKCGGDWGELGFCDPGLRCVHGICSSAKKKPQPCTPRSLNVQSDCPSGFWCKIQIPGIPDADIPDLAVCVKGKPQVSATTKASTVSTANRQGKLPDECKHPPSEGPCKAAFPRWYYNMVKRKCKEFLYGGCDGNANNFQTEAACKSFCMQQNISSGPVVKHTPTPQIERTKAAESAIITWKDVCNLPKVVGPCRASFPRWYFDAFLRKCIKFAYGGCNGNMNSFRTKAECKIRCMRRRVKTRARAAVLWYGALRRRSSAYMKIYQG